MLNAKTLIYFLLLFLDTILWIRNMSSLCRETWSCCKCWNMTEFFKLLHLSAIAVARSVFHRPCTLHYRSWVSGLVIPPHRQNVSRELGMVNILLSDSIVLRSLWSIPLDFSAEVASWSCSEALGTDLETTFEPQTCSSPAGVMPFIQQECSGSWTEIHSPLGLPSLYRTVSGKPNKGIEKKWNPSA